MRLAHYPLEVDRCILGPRHGSHHVGEVDVPGQPWLHGRIVHKALEVLDHVFALKYIGMCSFQLNDQGFCRKCDQNTQNSSNINEDQLKGLLTLS